MAITIANRADLIRAVSALGFQVSAEQGVFDGMFGAPTVAGVSAALKAKPQVAALATVTTPDATDEATAITLVNALKVSVNAIIAALKA